MGFVVLRVSPNIGLDFQELLVHEISEGDEIIRHFYVEEPIKKNLYLFLGFLELLFIAELIQ